MSDGVAPRSQSAASVAYDALNLAKQVARDQEGHEDICAERYGNIHKAMEGIKTDAAAAMTKIETSVDKQFGEIKGILKWAGGALFSVIIALLGFLATQQFNANDQARKQAEAKIDLLERQLLQQARPPVASQP